MSTESDINDGLGRCPVCRGTDGYLNVGSDHWFYCKAHETKWFFGSNLFSGWHEETEADWHRNAATMTPYREVEPIDGGANAATS